MSFHGLPTRNTRFRLKTVANVLGLVAPVLTLTRARPGPLVTALLGRWWCADR